MLEPYTNSSNSNALYYAANNNLNIDKKVLASIYTSVYLVAKSKTFNSTCNKLKD